MIKAYDDFIFENRIVSIVLEKKLFSSSKFIERIGSISSDSEVASIIYHNFLKRLDVESDISQNYIDVTDTPDMISFLPDSKVNISDGLFKIDAFVEKGRGQIKIGRFARAFFKNKDILSSINRYDAEIASKFTDSDYEKFVNLYKASYNVESDIFKIVSGTDIKKYYNKETYASNFGNLGNSCMNSAHCSTFFDIYVLNSDKCQMLCYFDSDMALLGRALVWKLDDEISGCKYVMDRVYTVEDSDIIKFVKYAIKENWLYKWKMSYDDVENMVFRKDNDFVVANITIKLDETNFDEYPFMDTFSYIDLDKNIISNVAFGGCILCTETDGSYTRCYSCDGDGVVASICDGCDGDGEIYCDMCNSGYCTCPYCNRGKIICRECRGSLVNDNKLVTCDKCVGKGSTKKFLISRKCDKCGGNGKVGSSCEECSEGLVTCDECDGDFTYKCTECDGDYISECTECNGDGRKEVLCTECSDAYISNLQSLIDYKTPVVSELASDILKEKKDLK